MSQDTPMDCEFAGDPAEGNDTTPGCEVHGMHSGLSTYQGANLGPVLQATSISETFREPLSQWKAPRYVWYALPHITSLLWVSVLNAFLKKLTLSFKKKTWKSRASHREMNPGECLFQGRCVSCCFLFMSVEHNGSKGCTQRRDLSS